MTQEEMYARARLETERRRQRAEDEAAARRAEVMRELPQLAELEARSAELGAAAARLGAAGNPEAKKAKLAELEACLEQRRALLAEVRLREDDLRPRYSCALCNDTGHLGGNPCSCVQKRVQQLRREEINRSSMLPSCRFNNFSLDVYPERMPGTEEMPRRQMGDILRYCREYAADFSLQAPSLFLYGTAGLGKTHLALSIAGEVLEKGFAVLYVSAPRAFARAESEKWERADESSYFQSLLAADLLILDDLGTEYLTAYVQSCLYELVNSRMGRRPTIYTTNIDSQAFLEQRYTEKISSRLLGECQQLPFLGLDVRLQQRQG